jgi:phage shock protein PspC (stress-responsive transcriptional regulator)
MTTAAAPHSAPTDPISTESDVSNPGPPRSAWTGDRLHRKREDRMVAGVAAGMAEYFDLDPGLVRVGFVALAFLGGVAIPVYLAAWLLIPEEGSPISAGEELLDRQQARRATTTTATDPRGHQHA